MARTRRTFTSEYKAKVVLQLINGQKSLAEISREYRLNQQRSPAGTQNRFVC